MSSNTRITPTTTTTTMSSNITTATTATWSSNTRRTTVPCVHDVNVLPPPNDGRLIVRSKFQHFRRIIYHHRETGRVIATTPYRPASAPTVSNPFNPLCDRCKHNFLFYLRLLGGYSPSGADHLLQGLQLEVMDTLDRIQMDAGDDHHSIVFQDLLFCNIAKHEELHTWDEEEYIGSINQLGRQERARAAAAAEVEVRATPAADAEAVEELEKVEVDAVEEGLACSVCLDELGCGGDGGGAAKEEAEEVVVVKVPCGHMFHKGCIVEWFGRSHFCPLCPFEMPRAVFDR